MTDEARAPVEVLKVAAVSKPVLVAGAIKAIAISRGYVMPAGLDLVCVPSFIELSIDGQERTGIILLVEMR